MVSRQDESSWAGIKVLITGGSGFLGSNLSRRLQVAGGEVYATSRRQRADRAGEPTWLLADLADVTSARRVVETVKPDVIFHLAGSVGASPDLELVLPTFHSLLTSTVNVLLAATEIGCRRVVLTGSLTEPTNESLEPIPQSPYAAAKWAGVAYGRMFRTLYRTPVVIVRPFMTYGPGQAAEKLVPSVTAALLKGHPPKLASGLWKADWVYISDVIEGLLRAATVPGIEGMTFDLGSGTLTSVRGVVDLLVQAVGNEKIKPMFGAIPDRPGEREIAANTAFSASKLGWRATTSLGTGLHQTVEWYRAKSAASTAIALR